MVVLQGENELVSVVIPAYNAGATIAETLASALGQTYRDLEIIAVDDGSTDDTAAVVAGAAANDPRIRLLRQANSGVAAARNYGIAEARANLIAILDADDLWHPTKVAKQVAAIRQGGAAVELEAGPWSQWLHAGLVGAGLPAISSETRHVKAGAQGDDGEDRPQRCARHGAAKARAALPCAGRSRQASPSRGAPAARQPGRAETTRRRAEVSALGISRPDGRRGPPARSPPATPARSRSVARSKRSPWPARESDGQASAGATGPSRACSSHGPFVPLAARRRPRRAVDPGRLPLPCSRL